MSDTGKHITFSYKNNYLNIYLSTLIPQVTNAANTADIPDGWRPEASRETNAPIRPRGREREEGGDGREGGGERRGGKVREGEGERRTQRRIIDSIGEEESLARL